MRAEGQILGIVLGGLTVGSGSRKRHASDSKLNHYRLEAGRLGENRGYGLKSSAHDLVT